MAVRDRNILLISLAMVLVLSVVFRIVFVPSYAVNDDVFMTMIASGSNMTHEPDEHLLGINVILGNVLKYLYGYDAGFPWYGYFIFLLYVLSAFVLLYSLLKYEFSLTRLLFFGIYLLIVEMSFLMHMQFTTAAFVLAQGGVFLFLTAFMKRPENSRTLYLTGAVMLLLGAMVRIESYYLALVLAVPVLTVSLLRDFKAKRLVPVVSFFAVVMLSAIALTEFNEAYYDKDDSWKGMYERIRLTRDFIDNNLAPYTPETRHVFDKAGWSANDYNMFMLWFFADTKRFGTQTLKEILSRFPRFKKHMPLGTVVWPLKHMFRDIGFNVMLIAIIVFMLFMGRKEHLVSVLLTVTLSVTLLVLLILYKKIPPRVYLPMFSFSAFTALFFATDSMTLNLKRSVRGLWQFVRILAVVATIVLSIMVTKGHVEESRANLAQNRALKRMAYTLGSSNERLFVIWAESFPLERLMLPFESIQSFANFRILSLSMMLQTPLAARTMQEFGITDIYTGLYEKRNVFLISKDEYLPFYQKYVKEHYGANVTFRNYFQDRNVGVYRVIRVN